MSSTTSPRGSRTPTESEATDSSALSDTSPDSSILESELDGFDDDPVVVCGFSVKFPQDATSAEALWKMLIERRCASTDFPADRTNPLGFHRDQKRANTLPVTGGHFIKEDLSRFDADFFSISPAEAASIDPMQRWLLEAAYLALENAGIPMESVNGTSTGVYAGCFSMDYTLQLARDPENPPPYAALGMSLSMLANRLSWFFNLHGPSIGLDSACSSTAMALDIACQALKTGSCDMALVAGSNLANAPEFYTWMTNVNFLSKDSRCYSFDDRANGYARGEGIGVVVLKKLSHALRDGNVIRAVIRSTGSNEDGRTPGITQPSRQAQERLIRETYRKAGLSMGLTRFFEAHGTGTPIGDPREAYAIGGAFQKYRSVDEPLYVGALKSNIGHLEGVSGLAGLVKAVMALEKGIIPPNTNFNRVNPKIDADYLRIKFPQKATPWPTKGLRRASVNSFGYGGANSHMVIDDAYNYMRLRGLRGSHQTVATPPEAAEDALIIPPTGPSVTRTSTPPIDAAVPRLLVWSAADKNGIERLMPLYEDWFNVAREEVAQTGTDFLGNLAYTLDSHRSRLPWRWYAVLGQTNDLKDIRSRTSPVSRARTETPRVGFVFSGQGAQWPAMGRELLGYSSYEQELERAGEYLKSLGCPWSVTEELLKPEGESNLDKAEFSQTLCTVLQVGLVNLLREFGLEPSGTVGHSSGEIAAAYAAGHISCESAWKIAYYRGLCSSQIAERSNDDSSQTHGAMLSVSVSEAEARDLIAPLDQTADGFGVSLACVNSPSNVTLAGEEPLIDQLKELLDARGIFARKLRVPVAYHSRQMEEVSARYTELLGSLDASPSTRRSIPMISSVSGNHISAEELWDPSYWALNMVSTVRFSTAVAAMCAQTEIIKSIDGSHINACVVDHLLEIGPHAVLQGPIRDILAASPRGKSITYSSALRRGRPATDTMLSVVGDLYAKGSPLNLRAVNEPDGTHTKSARRHLLVNLPAYPFDHSQQHWHESRLSRNYRLRPTAPSELLGVRSRDWNAADARWRHFIRLSEMPWVDGHVVNNTVLYPASGMLAMVMEAARDLTQPSWHVGGYTLSNVRINAPMDLTSAPGGVLEVQTSLRAMSTTTEMAPAYEFTVWTYHSGSDTWAVNCSGSVVIERTDVLSPWQARKTEEERSLVAAKLSKTISDCTTSVDAGHMYKFLDKSSYQYGPVFQGAQQQYCREGSDTKEASAEVKLFASTTEPHVVHPASLDAMLHICFTALTAGGTVPMATSVITGFKNIWVSDEGISAPGQDKVKACVSISTSTKRGFSCDGGALAGSSNDMKLWYEGMDLTNVGSVPASTARNTSLPDPRMFCMKVDLKVALDKLEPHQVTSLLGVNEYVPQLAEESRESSFDRDLRLLVLVALERAAETCNVESLGEDQNEAWKIRFLHWAKDQLAQARKDPSWSNAQSPVGQVRQNFDQHCRHLAEANAVGQLYSEVAANLLSIIQGDVDLAGLVQEKGLLASYSSRQAAKTSAAQTSIYKYLDLLAHQNSGMKVLELRTGGDSTTQALTRALASGPAGAEGVLRCHHLDVADISPSPGSVDENTSYTRGQLPLFPSQATLGKIDLQHNIEEQGYATATYDLVVVNNLLWAPGDLRDNLKQVRTLLKPSGKLILSHPVLPQGWAAPFILGLLPHNWSAAEKDPSSLPCLNTTWWDTQAADAGFGKAELVLRDGPEEGSSGMLGSIVYSAEDEKLSLPRDVPTTVQQVTIVANEDSIPQQSLAHDLLAVCQKSADWQAQILSPQDLVLQTQRNPEDLVILLLDYGHSSLLASLDQESWVLVKSLIQYSHHILWVSAGGGVGGNPEHGALDGFARTMRFEHYQLHIVTLALDLAGEYVKGHTSHVGDIAREMAKRQPHENYEQEYVEINGLLHTRRLVGAQSLKDDMDGRLMPYQVLPTPVGQVAFEMSTSPIMAGLPEEPHYREAAALSKQDLAPGEVDIQVRALRLLSQDDPNSGFGGYATGVVVKAGTQTPYCEGDTVLVATQSVPLRSHIRGPPGSVARLPPGVSFSDACATIHAAVTAYNAFVEVARVRPGDSVMVQDGASPIGQAALQALAGQGVSDVWTTVSDESESDKISAALLNKEHILPHSWFDGQGSSMLASRWKQRFDIVLIPYAHVSTPLHAECLRSGGQYIVLHHRSGDAQHSVQQIHHAAPNVSLSLLQPGSELPTPACLQSAASALRLATPQRASQFSTPDLSSALKRLQTSSDKDAVVVNINDSDTIDIISPNPPKVYLSPDATYLVAGGLGGLGRSISRWLVRRGARNLILLSRSGPRTDEARALISELKAEGVHVETPPCDITDREALRAMLDRQSLTMPPVRGCIQASMVMTERIFQHMDLQDWKATVNPKVVGSWNLHLELPSGLDFFILTSSIMGILGTGSLAAYNTGNTYEDALAHYRVSHGERATALDLGGIPDAGFLAEVSETQDRDINTVLRSHKYVHTYVKDVCALLDVACDPTTTQHGNSNSIGHGYDAASCQAIVGLRPISHWKHLEDVPATMCQPFWGHMHHFPQDENNDDDADPNASQAKQSASTTSIADKMAAAAGNLAQMAEVTTEALAGRVASLLGSARDAVDVQQPMHLYGLDSLTAIDVRNWVAKVFDVDVAVFEILGGATFTEAAMSIARKVQARH